MQQTFHRDRFTWLAYLSLAVYGYFLNGLGPITPFLKEELHLSYTVSSFHFTAFAVGILLIATLAIVITRYEAALSTYARADRQTVTARVGTQFRENLIDRMQATEEGLDGAPAQDDLRRLEEEFDATDQRARTAGEPRGCCRAPVKDRRGR